MFKPILSAIALLAFVASFVLWIMAMNRRKGDDAIFTPTVIWKIFRSDWFTPTGYKLWIAAHICLWTFSILLLIRSLLGWDF